jgi:hypothetical protein
MAVWQSETQDGSGEGIVARRFDPAGTPLTDDLVVNTFTANGQASPSIAAAADGRTVVVWSSFGQDGAGDGVFGQRFDAAGNRLGAEFQVNASAPGDQIAPRVAAGADGSFVVVWQHIQGATRNIGARRFDSSGTPLGGDFVVQTLPDTNTYRLALAADASTNFVVVWQTFGVAGDPGFGLRQQRFSASGAPRGFELHTNTFTVRDQVYAAIASDPAGNLVAIWMSNSLGTTFDIAAQRFGGVFPSALAVDTAGNGVLEPGDSADLRPSWRNLSTQPQLLIGALTALTGPAGATYTITDGAGDYGTVSNGVTAACADCYGVSVSAPPARPALHWDAVATESITPTLLGQVKHWSLHIGDSFTDVPRASTFYRFVETLLHHSVTAGCGGGAYCPAGSTTREQMAVFVLVAKEGAGYLPPACITPVFTDVPAASPFCRWVEELARRGVTGGCGGGNYCPTVAVSREQMAVFVLRTLDPTFDPPFCTSPLFDDVPISSPFCRWIEELARRGIVSGCGGGNYCPAAAVTREQMSVFLTGTFGLILYGP